MNDDELPPEWRRAAEEHLRAAAEERPSFAREAARLSVSQGALGMAWAQHLVPELEVEWEDMLRVELAGPPPAATPAPENGPDTTHLLRVLQTLPDRAGLPAVVAALRREFGPPSA